MDEELNDVFYDAYDFIPTHSVRLKTVNIEEEKKGADSTNNKDKYDLV